VKIGDLVYHAASLKGGEKYAGIIIKCDYANSFDDRITDEAVDRMPESGDIWYYKVKWLDTGDGAWYDMEEVERVNAPR
jgi:hypothetical protein